MAILAIVHDKRTTQRTLRAQAIAGSGRENTLRKVSQSAEAQGFLAVGFRVNKNRGNKCMRERK